MPETITVQGTIESIVGSISTKNKEFLKVRLEGNEQTYFDWRKVDIHGQGFKELDAVRMKVTNEKFPSIQECEKGTVPLHQRLDTAAQAQPLTPGKHVVPDSDKWRTPDQFMRGTALECAVELMKRTGKPAVPIMDFFMATAVEFYCWIKTGKWAVEDKGGQ